MATAVAAVRPRRLNVRLSIPKGAGVQQLGMLNAAGKLRRIVRVIRHAQRIVVVRMPATPSTTRTVRLRGAGATLGSRPARAPSAPRRPAVDLDRDARRRRPELVRP